MMLPTRTHLSEVVMKMKSYKISIEVVGVAASVVGWSTQPDFQVKTEPDEM